MSQLIISSTSAQVAQAIHDLGSRREAVLQRARTTLREHLTEATPALIATAEAEARKRPAIGTILGLAVGVGIGTVVLAVLAAIVGILSLSHLDSCSGGIGSCSAEEFGGLFRPVKEAFRWTSRRHQNVVELLSESEDIAVIPALLTAYKFSENGNAGVVRKGALRRLANLLPQIEAGKLPSTLERQLHELLFDDNPNITLATLTALERIGGQESLVAVNRFLRENGDEDGHYWRRRSDLKRLP